MCKKTSDLVEDGFPNNDDNPDDLISQEPLLPFLLLPQVGSSVVKYQIYLKIVTILPLKIFVCVTFMLSKGLQNDTNTQHKFLHMGWTRPPPLHNV